LSFCPNCPAGLLQQLCPTPGKVTTMSGVREPSRAGESAVLVHNMAKGRHFYQIHAKMLHFSVFMSHFVT
jgi:hypothetical protein